MQPYPQTVTPDFPSIVSWINFVSRVRPQDIQEFTNINSTFIAGRKVGKVPASSTDVAPTDRVGDFNYDVNYIYICVLSGSTVAWRRASLGTW